MTNDENKSLTVYLISGPLGVGKSTASKALARRIERCALIEGDYLLHVFEGEWDAIPPWEERLSLAWENITAVTKNFLQHRYNVVIDFVVEDELEWVCNQISPLDVKVKYIVLRAEKETIIERLSKRGDLQYLNRSLFLLNKLEQSPSNQPFLYDTTGKLPENIADEILKESSYAINSNHKYFRC